MINLILTAALKGTVALGAAWIATALLRRSSADLRHRIWLAALVATALLMIPWAPPETLRITVDTSAAGIGLAAASRRSISVLPVAFSVAWSVIAALLLLRWGAGIFRLQRITRGSRMEHGVLVSDAITTPMTWGAIRPVILLPAYVQGWPCDQRDVVIQHERAHIERRDWLWQAFAQVMSAMFWFHPLVWLAAFQMRQEAEHAADDATLATGVRAPDYADRLLAVARQLPGRSPTAAAAGVAMVRQPALTSRIAAILEAGRIRAVASAGARLGIVLAAIAVMVPLSAFQNRDVYHVGEDGVKAPSIVYKVNPSYAPEPKAAKIQGTVTITAVVNAQGRADDIRVSRSLDPQLDANAIAAVSQWLFKPGTKDDQPVDVAVTIEINFKLQ